MKSSENYISRPKPRPDLTSRRDVVKTTTTSPKDIIMSYLTGNYEILTSLNKRCMNERTQSNHIEDELAVLDMIC